MTTLPINLPSAPIATPEAVALLESQEDVLQTAVSTTLRQHLFHNHGRLMTPRQLPTASQEIVQDYLYYLRHADLPHLTNTVNNLANQGLGHLSALAVTDTLSATSYTLLQEANLLTPEITPHLDEYRRHFLHKYMQAREHINITSREHFYQNVEAALEKQVGQERDLRHELEEQRSQLTQERALLTSLLDSIPDLIFYKDINSVYLGCNDAYAEFAGRAETDLIGKTDFDLFPHDVATFFREQDVEMMAQQQARQNEEWVNYPDGRRVLLDTLKTPFYDADNNLLGLIGISRDITASYESQAEQLRLSYVIEQSLDGTAVANLDGIIEFVNPVWAAMHGYTPDELIGQHLSIFHTPEQIAQEVDPVNQQAISSGQPQRAEIGHVRKDGSTFPTMMTIGLLKGSDGSPIGLVASVQDISEQKAATAALRESEIRLKSLVNNVPGTIYRCALDADYTMEVISDDIIHLSGYPAADFIGNQVRSYANIIYEEDRELVDTVILESVQNQTSYNIEYRIYHADGRLIWIGERGQAIYDENGATRWLDGVLLDITGQKEAEAALAKRAREMQAVFEVSNAIATILDPTSLLQEVADRAKANFNLYHAHIYLLDETGSILKLAAGAGDVGREMVAQNWQIPISRTDSVVARVARNKAGAIVNDVRNEPGFLFNEMLPDTRAELSVPLLVGEQLLGVLDVQANTPDYFSADDLIIQTSLAAQVSVAIQNARSFVTSEAARQELSLLTRRLTHEGWQSYLTQQTTPQINVTYGQDLGNDTPLQQTLTIQGESIGHMTIGRPQALEADATEILTAVAERLSSHVENLRLTAQTEAALAQTEQQAERLSLLNEMGAALSRANTLADIYQAAARYTGQILDGDRTSLALLNPAGDSLTLIALEGIEAGNIIGENLPLAGTAIARALHEQRSLIAPQDFPLGDTQQPGALAAEGIQSFICAPLLTSDRPLGALNVGSKKANAYDRTDTYLVQQVVSLLAATLESRRLFEETRRRAERETLLNVISQKIQSAPTIESALQTAVTELGQALKLKQIQVRLNIDKKENGHT